MLRDEGTEKVVDGNVITVKSVTSFDGRRIRLRMRKYKKIQKLM